MDEMIETRKKNSYVELVTDNTTSVYFKEGKEIIELKTPQYLRQYICEKVDLSEYEKYILLTCLIPNGRYNSVSDKKGIWGLTNQVKGLFEESYLCENGKVYLGITNNVKMERINGLVNNIEIYIPKKNSFSFVKVFEIFDTAKCDLLSSNNEKDALLEKLQKSILNSIIIHSTASSIKLFGNNIEELF